MATNYLEYHFCLVGQGPGEPEYYWSGQHIPGDISDPQRKKILEVVLNVTALLLDHAKPELVLRHTQENGVPSIALEKHHAISVVFKSCGYEVKTTDVFQGKRMWMMKRVSSS